MITIVNYGSGNIKAISNIFIKLKIPSRIANLPEEVIGTDKIILPGVGAFDETISMLNTSGFRPILDDEVLNKKIPVLGICVGMQILARKSEEGKLPGLGWVNGEVKQIDSDLLPCKPKLPHLGWNSVETTKTHRLFHDIEEELGFYFLHSYYFSCSNHSDILSTTEYGKTFASSINHANIFGVQFHPEKSHQNGINLLKNFASL